MTKREWGGNGDRFLVIDTGELDYRQDQREANLGENKRRSLMKLEGESGV